MSNTNTMFNFPHPGTPMSHDQTNLLLLDDSPTHTSFGSNARPGNSALPLPSAPFIDALLIDNLAKDFALEDIQCANLHAFVQIGSADGLMSKSDLLTRMYALAALYADIAERHRLSKDQGAMDAKGLFNDLKIRLEAQFELTKDQMRNIRRTANDMIYQPTRTNFITMNVDLMKHIRDNHTSMGLSNVIGNPSREKTLASVLKKTCSSVRNAFRQDIRNSIIGSTACSLAQFTFRTANKYRCGQFDENTGLGYTIHNVILRRFGLDHPDIIGMPSTSGDDDGEDSDSPPTKRARTQGGRIAKGEDFWGKVDTYFAAMVHKHGRVLIGPQWQECVNDMIRRDNAQFAPELEAAGSVQPVVAQGASLASAFAGF